ncbi:MAG: GntR family transcriptional regulator [Dehalococcoidia bacterium]
MEANRPGQGIALKETPFRGRLADAAYQRIKQDIETGSIAPGAVISERDLVKDFEMSRTPVREALQRLLSEGYLQQLHRGYEVVQITHREIINAYAVRGMLEGMAARQAAGTRRRVDVARLQDVHDRELEALSSEKSQEELGAITEEFHVQLAEMSSNDLLQSVLKVARSRTEPYRRRRSSIPGVAAADIEDHAKIIRAIQDGHPLLAELTVRMLIRRAIRELTGQEIIDEKEMAIVLEFVEGMAAEQPD